MELDKELSENIFKTKIYEEKSVDEFVKDAYDSIKKDDKKVSDIIDQMLELIRNEFDSEDEEQKAVQISFYAPILAELFKSSAEFKRQKTDLLNSIQKFVSLDKKTGQQSDSDMMTEIWKDILERKENEQNKTNTK